MMNEIDIILKKIVRLIKSSKPEHERYAARYISLANRRLHSLSNDKTVWKIIGASTAIKNAWYEKFGFFVPEFKAIQ